MGLISRVSSRTYRKFIKQQCLTAQCLQTRARRPTPRRSCTSESDGPPALRRRPPRPRPRPPALVGSTQPTRSDDASRPPVPARATALAKSSSRALRRAPFSSWLLLVTGPFKINGVPMRRVNQKYVIATSTKIDFSAAIPDRVNDEYFSRIELNAHEGQNEGEIFQTKKA